MKIGNLGNYLKTEFLEINKSNDNSNNNNNNNNKNNNKQINKCENWNFGNWKLHLEIETLKNYLKMKFKNK